MSDLFRAHRQRPPASPRFTLRRWPLHAPPPAPCVLREPVPEASAATPGLLPDLDGVWKQALQTWLPDCLALFWPKIHQRIDWSVAPIFLDQELRRLDRILKQGTKRVDVLVQLRLKTGGEALLLIHLEVQAGRIDAAFAERMFRYRIRLYEKYPHHTILSCAILLDREHGSTTETFRSAGLGDELIFRFPVVNLARWRRRQPILEKRAATNPFAVIVIAQLRYRATRPDAARMGSKLQLARSLAEWGYDGDTRRALLDLIDSLLVLPEPLEEVFTEILEQTGEATVMQQLNSVQRVMLRREKAKSELQGASLLLQALLRQKFGELPEWVATQMAEADTGTLQHWALQVLDASRLEDVFAH